MYSLSLRQKKMFIYMKGIRINRVYNVFENQGKLARRKIENIMYKTEIVFCYKSCSDLLWEKKCSSDREKNLKFAMNLQKFWDHWNNLLKQWKFRTIFGNRMRFYLATWRFLIYNSYRKIIIQIGKNINI